MKQNQRNFLEHQMKPQANPICPDIEIPVISPRAQEMATLRPSVGRFWPELRNAKHHKNQANQANCQET